MKTNKPTHPGAYLKSKKPEALTNTELASKLNICRTTLWRFLKGERRLDPDMAARLGELHKDAAFWLKLQLEHDLARAERH